MPTKSSLVFLLDVDNTLLDNDRFTVDLSDRLKQGFGDAGCNRFWEIYLKLRDQNGYADYLGALQAFSAGHHDNEYIFQISSFMLEYPFENRLYPHALAVIAHLQAFGLPTILSDGDIVFQPRKIHHSGIWAAVKGRVMIFPHKESAIDSIKRRYPAERYIMVDDKPKLLAAMKKVLGDRLTTIFVSQGHYAQESLSTECSPPPDRFINNIADLIKFRLSDFIVAASSSAASQQKSIAERNAYE